MLKDVFSEIVLPAIGPGFLIFGIITFFKRKIIYPRLTLTKAKIYKWIMLGKGARKPKVKIMIDGAKKIIVLEKNFITSFPHIGSEIDVYIDKNNPKKAYDIKDWTFYGHPIMFAAMGAFFTILQFIYGNR